MADSPHQLETLSERITRLKSERDELRAARSQILVLGQSMGGGGVSTTYPGFRDIDERIKQLDATIEALTAQLIGADLPPPGVNLLRHTSDYS